MTTDKCASCNVTNQPGQPSTLHWMNVFKPSNQVIRNGDSVCGYGLPIDGLATQTGWLGSKISGHLALTSNFHDNKPQANISLLAFASDSSKMSNFKSDFNFEFGFFTKNSGSLKYFNKNINI